MKRFLIFFVLIWLFSIVKTHAQTNSQFSLIPQPSDLVEEKGEFILSDNVGLKVNDNGLFYEEIGFLQKTIHEMFGKGLSSEVREKNIIIDKCGDCTNPEAYRLSITKDSIHISASDRAGTYYALQTLKQILFSARKNPERGEIYLPLISVNDCPAYGWRGLMLDVSRHFFSIEYLKKQIDLLSYYKLNKLHLHLTDDQGWRIEIKKYPELTEQGAWRTFNNQDSVCMEKSVDNSDFEIDPRFIIKKNGQTLYGGYYTQDQMKDLIEYARQRHVEIIPEIDMPGHMMAAISAHPELSCTGEAAWGESFSVPLCPCNESVFPFVENVLSEIVDLFPSKYIHIGADEVEKHTWSESTLCQQLMHEKGYQNVSQLQTYFVERVQNFLKSKGKEIIAWDEVLEGGINTDVNIMYWRDWVGEVPQKVVNNGNTIIFTPGNPLYLSRTDSSFYDLYRMKNIANVIPENKKELIKGIQANVWSESIPSENLAFYLIYPRLIALSEIAWTPQDKHNFDSFKNRMATQFQYLDKMQIKHSKPTYALIPIVKTDMGKKQITLSFDSEQVSPIIYYTLDGSLPTRSSLRYDSKIAIKHSADVCAAIYMDAKMQEPVFRRSFDYHKAIGKPVKYNTSWNASYPANKENSLTDGYRGGEHYNDGYWQGFTNDMDVVIDLEKETSITNFAATFMQITGPGVYMPQYVEVSISCDGNSFEKVLTVKNTISESEKELTFKKFAGKIKSRKARYIKVFAKCRQGSFIFTDEIIIN